MYYLGYDFSSHRFCLTKKEHSAVEICHYNRNAPGNNKVVRAYYPLEGKTKEEALQFKEEMNETYNLKHGDDRYESLTSWGTIRRCSQCGRPYFFPDPERRFFVHHNLPVPERCFKCRSERKRKNKDSK